MKCILFILGLVSLASRTEAYDWWNAPYTDDSFNDQVEYGDNITLLCNDTRIPPGIIYDYWVLPDLRIFTPGHHESFKTLDGIAGWYSSTDGKELTMYLLQEQHFGLYYCAVHTEDTNGKVLDNFIVKKGVNMRGPFFGDLWEKYKLNTIIGGSAAGGFLLFAILIAIVYHFRYHSDPKEEPIDEMTLAPMHTVSYDNAAFTADGVGNGKVDAIPMEDAHAFGHSKVGPEPVMAAAEIPSTSNDTVQEYNDVSYPQSKSDNAYDMADDHTYAEVSRPKSMVEVDKAKFDPSAM